MNRAIGCAALLGASALVAFAPGQATAAATTMACLDYPVPVRHEVKPRSCIVYTASRREPIETITANTLSIQNIRWRSWGGKTATGRGIYMRMGTTLSFSVTVFGRRRCALSSRSFYTQVRIGGARGAKTYVLDEPVC